MLMGFVRPTWAGLLCTTYGMNNPCMISYHWNGSFPGSINFSNKTVTNVDKIMAMASMYDACIKPTRAELGTACAKNTTCPVYRPTVLSYTKSDVKHAMSWLTFCI